MTALKRWFENNLLNIGTGSGVFKQKTGYDVELKSLLAGYGFSVTSGANELTLAQKTSVTTLTDAATIAIDAAVGPQYMVTLGGNRTLGNPTNPVAGQDIVILVAQDGTGSRTLAFDTNWIAADNTTTVNPTASSVTLIYASARDFGGGVKYYFTLQHAAETGSGEANTASNVGTGTGIFKAKSGVDLQFKSLLGGYGISLTGGTNEVTIDSDTTVTTLTDGATIAIDAAVGPNYEVTIAGNRTLSNPTNAAVGQILIIGVKQDATGNRTLAFDTDFIATGQLFQVALTASAVSIVVAEARSFGGTLKWYYTIHHKETTYQITPSQLTSVAATGTLTNTANFANTDTVTTGTKTYTFQTALTNVDGNVLIGATASDSLDNLIAAINLGAGSGTVYAAATTANGFVSAVAGAGDTMDVTALVSGTAGNTIATTETSANASWGAATLSGGNNDTIDYAPTGWAGATTVRASSNASYNLHGFDAAVALQKRKRLVNVGSFNIVIKHQSTTETTATNRIICPGATDITLVGDDVLDLEYDGTTTRWRVS
jgi:hypothetical protein